MNVVVKHTWYYWRPQSMAKWLIALFFAALMVTRLDAAPIHDAVILEDIAEVRRLLNAGANPNAIDEKGFSPLHWAIRIQNIPIIQLLLNNDADIDQSTQAPDPSAYKPIHFAVFEGNSTIINILLNRGAQIDARTNQGRTPLHISTIANQSNATNLLLSRGASTQDRDSRGQLAIDSAPQTSAVSEIIEIYDDSNTFMYIRFPLSVGYFLAFETFNSNININPGAAIRIGVGSQFSFPIGVHALGAELGLHAGLYPIGGDISLVPILDFYTHLLFRFNLISDITNVEITPFAGAYLTIFNQIVTLQPDIGLRLGFTNRNIGGSIFADVSWITPFNVLITPLPPSITSIVNEFINGIRIMVGYSFAIDIVADNAATDGAADAATEEEANQ